MKKLVDIKGKSNNLQALRFIAAVMVIISHSFSVGMGDSSKEWFIILTNGQLSMGNLAVAVFFCAGGYLIAKSMCKAKKFSTYFKARINRIFPLLIIVVGLSMFLLGPIMTNLNLKDYMSDVTLYKYALNGLLIPVHELPGVFSNNIYGPTVNGSLWTLPVEFLCYIGCFLLYKLQMLKKKSFLRSVPIVLIGCGGIYYLAEIFNIELLLAVIRPGLLFYIGIFYYVYRDDIVLEKKFAVLSTAAIVFFNYVGMLNFALILFFPYVLLYVCFGMKQISEKIGWLGNLSYGIYLCGFPIQQTIVAVFGGQMSPYINMLISVPITIIIALVLYRFEK